MIVWINALVQGTTNPTTKLLWTTLETADLEGMIFSLPYWQVYIDSIYIAIISTSLYWTYMEAGIGFVVACLPPCAQLLDKISLPPLSSWFQSLRTNSVYSKRSGESHGRGTRLEDLEANKSWTLTQRNDLPSGGEDELGLITVIERSEIRRS